MATVRSYVSPGALQPNPNGTAVSGRSYVSPGAVQPVVSSSKSYTQTCLATVGCTTSLLSAGKRFVLSAAHLASSTTRGYAGVKTGISTGAASLSTLKTHLLAAVSGILVNDLTRHAISRVSTISVRTGNFAKRTVAIARLGSIAAPLTALQKRFGRKELVGASVASPHRTETSRKVLKPVATDVSDRRIISVPYLASIPLSVVFRTISILQRGLLASTSVVGSLVSDFLAAIRNIVALPGRILKLRPDVRLLKFQPDVRVLKLRRDSRVLLKYTSKAPTDDDSRFGVDLTDILEDGEQLVDVISVTATPNGLTISNPTVNGNIISWRVQGGVPGISYTVTITYKTNYAPSLSRSVTLPVTSTV